MDLFRDAEKYVGASLEIKNRPETRLHLSHILHRSCQTDKAIQTLTEAIEKFPENGSLKLFLAEVYAEKGDVGGMKKMYKQILHYDSNNIEALTEIAALAFEENLPEVAMKYYRRLVQVWRTRHGIFVGWLMTYD
ncbi:Tetratricopeptide repeat protein 8 [Rhizophlyctis rosea]|uniref:Tetratricopeptide repeat protein 8 n=1 Tax=Rhizophlyctis rosea TaxID=64517 RepID=A0AAD5SLP4_9FUNG|nr:Tetratricopeptide repeat protein 8 [Rhizophlyctis rosea]